MTFFSLTHLRPGLVVLLLLPSVPACAGEDSEASPGAGGASGAGIGGVGGSVPSGGNGAVGGAPAAGGTGASPAGCEGAERSGEGTYYDADGSGNCSFDATPTDLMVAAMNQVDYAESAACGTCVQIDGPKGQVTVRIVDRCPECPAGDIDLSRQAFEKIAELSAGRVAIGWRTVPCDVSGPLAYRFKEGSNQWWTAVQVRNHRFGIQSLEYERDGTFVQVGRENYNYFVEPKGMGPGPYKFRVTDLNGAQVVDTGIGHQEAQAVSGTTQLPGCGG